MPRMVGRMIQAFLRRTLHRELVPTGQTDSLRGLHAEVERLEKEVASARTRNSNYRRRLKQTRRRLRDREERLRSLRLDLRDEHSAIDLRSETADPVAAVYIAEDRPFVIDVPLDRCRQFFSLGIRCSDAELNPFVRSLVAYHDSRISNYAESPLREFYSHCRPSCASDVLGVPGMDFPPLEAVLPWQRPDRQRIVEDRRTRIIWENDRDGLDASLSPGWQNWGPVSRERGERELARLVTVFESIRRAGYQRRDGHRDGDIGGWILEEDDDWVCWIWAGGQHRVAALAALGHTHAPIRVRGNMSGPDSPIRDRILRRDVDAWPHVRSGLFDRKGALAVFDRIMAGEPPPGLLPPSWRTGSTRLR